jgi:hypothetical protein
MIPIGGTRRDSCLAIAVLTGIRAAVAASRRSDGARVHTETEHLLTRDPRQHLFVHLQCLGLRSHSRMPVGARYHLQADAASSSPANLARQNACPATTDGMSARVALTGEA